MHKSIKMDMPCEPINIVPMNPFISKCQIKVCYVSDAPNRNNSIITKETARDMANSLPGSPIVGYFNEETADFEEHNQIFEISENKIKLKDATRPYGFIDLNAKCWFQWFLDDDNVEREYLVTEGYLWTGQYPECKRVIEKGNNQSMELDKETLKASWVKSDNSKPQFFIIHEALITKLCILGEDFEPCFEGASINKVQFSFNDDFKQQLFSMMNELKEFLKEGGTQVFTRYAVEIGGALWDCIFSYIENKFPASDESSYSSYCIEGIYEEDNGQKFVALHKPNESKYFRLNFTIAEDNSIQFSESLVEITKSFTPAEQPQFSQEEIEKYKKKKDEEKKEEPEEDEFSPEGKNDESDSKGSQEDVEEDPDDSSDEEEEDKKKKKKYNLEEVTEYAELMAKFTELESKFKVLEDEKSDLETKISSLVDFKNTVEKQEKQDMIDSFYMLSDEDKKDVVENIDKYSLHDIEAQLSIICVRNKVDFSLDKETKEEIPTTYNLNSQEDLSTPAWVKAVLETAETLNY